MPINLYDRSLKLFDQIEIPQVFLPPILVYGKLQTVLEKGSYLSYSASARLKGFPFLFKVKFIQEAKMALPNFLSVNKYEHKAVNYFGTY